MIDYLVLQNNTHYQPASAVFKGLSVSMLTLYTKMVNIL